MMEKLKECGLVSENYDLTKHNTYHIKTQCKYFLQVTDISKIPSLIKFLKKEAITYVVLGEGSNVILPDEFFQGVIISLKKIADITIKDNLITVGAGVNLTKLVNTLINKDYTNLAFLYGIPGSLGGAIWGNAGCFKKEIFDYVKDVTIIDEQEKIVTLEKKDISYNYRYTEFKNRDIIILKARLYIELGDRQKALEEIKNNYAYRLKTQPLDSYNAGSVFCNPVGLSAGKLIEEANLKNKKVGGAIVSNKHANFIINENNAKSSDIIELINLIKKEVKKKYNIDLELEQKIIKW